MCAALAQLQGLLEARLYTHTDGWTSERTRALQAAGESGKVRAAPAAVCKVTPLCCY
jgi:hypothetical protein